MISYLLKKARTTPSLFLVIVVVVLLSACANSTQSISSSSPQPSAEEQMSAEDVAYHAELEAMDFSTLVQEQMALEAYMSINEETKIVTFDAESAREDGHAASVIALTDEMMTYQNQLMRKMKADGISDVTQVDVPIDPFPLAKRFQERTQIHLEKARVDNSSSE